MLTVTDGLQALLGDCVLTFLHSLRFPVSIKFSGGILMLKLFCRVETKLLELLVEPSFPLGRGI